MSKFARYLAPALVLSLGLGAALPASAAEPARPQSNHTQKAPHKVDGHKADWRKADWRKADGRKGNMRKNDRHLTHAGAHANRHRDCNRGKRVAMKDRYRHGPDGHHTRGHDRHERGYERNHQDRQHQDHKGRDGRRG